MNENYLVTKANDLIMTNYMLSTEEQKIILTLASMVEPQDEDFKSYKFQIADFISLLGLKTKTKYTEIPKITKDLMSKVIEIKKDEDEVIQISWLSYVEYKKKTGFVILEFNPHLKPYLLNLKDFYTSYKLANVLSLKGKYSVRLFEILKSHEYKKSFRISLDELKNLLKINSAYPTYSNFKKYVIEFARKELKENTDIYFDLEEIKTGKKVTDLNFKIKKNNKLFGEIMPQNIPTPQIQNSEEIDDIKKLKLMITEDITEADLYKIYKAANKDIKKIEIAYAHVKTNKEVRNIVGYMLFLAKQEDLQMPIMKKSKKVTNFEERTYSKDFFKKFQENQDSSYEYPEDDTKEE